MAAKVMAGVSLAEQGLDSDPIPSHVSVKESVFPFIKFAGVDIVLGPEMRSTGEVMGISDRFSIAFAKSQLAAGVVLPSEGTIFLSLTARTKRYVIPLGKKLAALGYQIVATAGTATTLEEGRYRCPPRQKAAGGASNLLDYLIDGQIQLIINTPSGKGARTDEGRIRASAVAHGVPCITTIPAAEAALRAMEALREEELSVQAIQDRFPALAKEA